MSIAAHQTEEQLVAQLEQLGVRYLSRQAQVAPTPAHAPDDLLANLVHQPSSMETVTSLALQEFFSRLGERIEAPVTTSD